MRDFGKDEFRPEATLKREQLARALFRAFGNGESAGPTFTDLPTASPYYRGASVAVKLGWMTAPGGAFSPSAAVTKITLDRALTRALGLKAEIRGLNRIRTSDGQQLARPPGFGFLVLAHQLRLHYNHGGSSEERELWPSDPVRRADGAYALHQAAITPSHRISALGRYRSVVLPTMGATRRQVVEFALAQVGAPYVYAGEWHEPTRSGYCCGSQAQGGFDCSGFVWWVMRAPDPMWDNTAYRPYRGWKLPERSSADMAREAPTRIAYGKTRPMDLLFFDTAKSGTGWRGVNHAGLMLGGGWMIHSASGIDGVGIDWVGDGWYRDRYVWARRLIGT